MRRNSENLLVLAGHEAASRRWSQPVPLVDVLRAAISEIEQYERVVLNVQPGIQVVGQAVNDVVHLVAEIVENATTFSPEDTQVYVTGQPLTSGGVLLDITDNGVGISEQEMAHANWRLDNPPVVDVAVSRRMGLFVVGRLAARHGVRVRLRHAQSGGLTALIWLPESVAAPESAQPLGRLRKFEADDYGPAPSLSAPTAVIGPGPSPFAGTAGSSAARRRRPAPGGPARPAAWAARRPPPRASRGWAAAATGRSNGAGSARGNGGNGGFSAFGGGSGAQRLGNGNGFGGHDSPGGARPGDPAGRAQECRQRQRLHDRGPGRLAAGRARPAATRSATGGNGADARRPMFGGADGFGADEIGSSDFGTTRCPPSAATAARPLPGPAARRRAPRRQRGRRLRRQPGHDPAVRRPAQDQRLPIFDSLESDWFRRSGKLAELQLGTSATRLRPVGGRGRLELAGGRRMASRPGGRIARGGRNHDGRAAKAHPEG